MKHAKAVKVEKAKASKAAPSPKKKAVASSTALVPAAMSDMPRGGDVVDGSNRSDWAACTVTRVTNNFVHTNGLFKKGANTVRLMPGMRVQVIIPPLDDKPTDLLILSVGVIHVFKSTGVKPATKYRAIIFRRRATGTNAWGDLETMLAASFPRDSHCNVSATTHT